MAHEIVANVVGFFSSVLVSLSFLVGRMMHLDFEWQRQARGKVNTDIHIHNSCTKSFLYSFSIYFVSFVSSSGVTFSVCLIQPYSR